MRGVLNHVITIQQNSPVSADVLGRVYTDQGKLFQERARRLNVTLSRSKLQDCYPLVTPSTKKYWKICYMNVDPMHAEMNSLMPDWSPGGPTPLNARINGRLDPFVQSQKDKLLHLREGLTESLAVVTKRSPLFRSETSRFGIHPADAGSDAYDRDFALSLLSREQDALYEINQALRRIDLGTYGICEMSGNPIPRPRLEAIPFVRFTVECQSQLERQKKVLRLSPRIISPFASLDTEEEEEELGQGEVHENDERYLRFKGCTGETT